jgi:hypothetical protein
MPGVCHPNGEFRIRFLWPLQLLRLPPLSISSGAGLRLVQRLSPQSEKILSV